MKQVAIAILTALLASIAVYQGAQSEDNLQVDNIIDYANLKAQCTTTLEIECAIDIERTVVACAKAFQTEGADIVADIKCAKDLLSDKKHCWPCICAEAKKKGWHVVGC